MLEGILTKSEAINKGFTINEFASGRPIGYKGPRLFPTEVVQVYTDLEEQLVEIVETLQPSRPPLADVEILEVCLRRGSPLHKLWQDLHLKKYPGNY